jgi:RHS repeat-associated protein
MALGRIIAQRKNGVATIDQSGNVQRIRYFPFGNVRSGSVATDRMYTGQQGQAFSRTASYFYNARFYSTGLGHFVSADSLSTARLSRAAEPAHDREGGERCRLR